MNVAIIGAGKVGGALATQLSKVGHRVFLGVRNLEDSKVKNLISENISAQTVSEAVLQGEVVIIATPATATKDVAASLGDVSGKIIIDATNSYFSDQSPYTTSAEAFLNLTNCQDVVKCFNTTGSHNMIDPDYNGVRIDAFVAGDSERGKKVASKLAKEVGFGEVYDLGGDDKFELIEQIAKVWIALAYQQGYGPQIGMKILKR